MLKNNKHWISTTLFLTLAIFLFIKCGDNSTNPSASDSNLNISPTDLNFATVALNQTKSMNVTVENLNESDIDLPLSIDGIDKTYFGTSLSSTVKITSKKSLIIPITFTPNAERSFTAVLKIGSKKTVNLSGSGSSTIKISVVDTLTFSNVKPNDTQTLKLTIQNVSTDSLNLNFSIDGSDKSVFSVKQTTLSIGSGKTGTIDAVFSPSIEKTHHAVLNIGSYAKVQLVGICSFGAQVTVSPTMLDFKTLSIGTSLIKKISLQNLNANPFTVQPSLSGTDASNFKIEYTPASALAQGTIDSVTVRFSPTEAKTYNAVIFIDAAKTVSANLTGQGFASAIIQISPNILDFGTVSVNNKMDTIVKITNLTSSVQSLTVKLTGIGSSAYTHTIPATIAANATINSNISFAPTSSGIFNGLITITASAVDATLNLKGNCTSSSKTPPTLICNTAAAPALDGIDNDACWASATEVKVNLYEIESTINDKRIFPASVRSVHTKDSIYFIVKIDDPSMDDIPNKFTFTGGDPKLESNWKLDTNGQDGISFVFPISANVVGEGSKKFADFGCFTSCHTAVYTNNYEGGFFPYLGKTDIWVWQAGLTNPLGYADDHNANGNDISSNPSIRTGDIPGRPFSTNNFMVNGKKLPISLAAGDNGNLNKRYIWDDTSEPFTGQNNPLTGKPFAVGDFVSGWKLQGQDNMFNQRSDVRAKGVWANGVWTVEFARALATENVDGGDVVFQSGKDYPFSIAFFDNVRKYYTWEYLNGANVWRPSHFGMNNPYVIILSIK
ncbi:MAG: choice-of-anchor D domain-containing protein [Candidatus Kapabacteria bacterium]|nr:choice-of-anchor D domain-containing protein [Candidatus Kapabacteria bacterium]